METTAQMVSAFAQEVKARAKADADAVQHAAGNETKTEREKREADDATQMLKLNQLGRIDEIRQSLFGPRESYLHRLDQAATQLRAWTGPATDPDVKAAAQAVAKAFGIHLDSTGLKQPPAPKKGPSPFAEE